MNEYYHNSTIKRKQCPNCEYANLYSGDTKAVKQGLSSKKKGEPKKRKVKTAKQKLEDALDTAWSKLVKLEGGNKCAVETCQKTKYLNSHHIYSRGKHSVRWDTINGICLCVGHHIGFNFSAHKTPASFIEWLRKKKGDKFMDDLELKSHNTSHYDEFVLKILLDELNKRINHENKKL
jgi:predicted restriction endonuclease